MHSFAPISNLAVIAKCSNLSSLQATPGFGPSTPVTTISSPRPSTSTRPVEISRNILEAAVLGGRAREGELGAQAPGCIGSMAAGL